MSEIKWTMVNDGIKLSYIGSNGAVIVRRGIGSRLYHGRDRQYSKGYYYTLNGKGYFVQLRDAKQAAEDEVAGVVHVSMFEKRS
jgi:hypothetical protein